MQARRAHESAGYVVMRHDLHPKVPKSLNFNVWWAHALSPSDKRWRLLMDFQRINHFPGTFVLGRKDRLTRCLARFRRRVGLANSDFYPRTHLLPSGYKEWKADFAASKGIWIYKPGAAARGNGIKVVTKLEQIGKNKTGLVQAYLGTPLLIEGYKFDIRVYVVATSFNPLKLYVFDNGLVRFSTCAYQKTKKNSSNRNRFMHLTNYSVNKKSAAFSARTDADIHACTGRCVWVCRVSVWMWVWVWVWSGG